jgi:hypothetical protein
LNSVETAALEYCCRRALDWATVAPPRFQIGGLKFRQLQPSIQRLRSDAGGLGGFLHTTLRKQRNRGFFLAAEFRAVAALL